ncbi:MAG: Ig-like domain-containing protein [Isosphaeraceae bacterium]
MDADQSNRHNPRRKHDRRRRYRPPRPTGGVDRQSQSPPVTLQSITVTPANPSIPIGGAQQFTATGLFSDDSTENLTSQVTWASATPSVATISATGLASALATGTSSITASLDGITGSTVLTATPPTPILQSITVTPANPHITVGATEQFTATGSFSNNSTENLTSEVIWTSDKPSVATTSATGLATALAMGTSSITASLSGITGEAMLTVTRTSTPFRFQTKTLWTATPRSLTVGQSITVSVSVSVVGAIESTATGTVTLTEGNTTLGPFLLRRGKYIFKTKATSAGTEVFRAAYNGNTALLASSSNKVGVLIRSPKPTKKRG